MHALFSLTFGTQQRQNLNEVENLYFHHSLNIRGLKLQPAPSMAAVPDHNPEPGTMNEPTSSSGSEPANASQDLKHEAGETHRSVGALARSEGNNPKSLPLSPTARRRGSLMQLDAPSRLSVDGNSTATVNTVPTQQPRSNPNIPTNNTGSPFPNPGKWNHPSRPPSEAPTPGPSQSISNVPFAMQHSSSSTVSNSPNMALTYDSFWSNHSTTRPFRSSFFNLLSASDVETNKITAQALLSGLSARNITSYLNNVGLSSDLITTTPSSP